MTVEKDPLAIAQNLIRQMASKSENFFLLTYEGTKIPRGAAIDNVEIGWTQNGMITGVGGQHLGYYERIVEFGPPSGNQHIMLISTNGKTLTPPPAGTVDKLELIPAASTTPTKNRPPAP